MARNFDPGEKAHGKKISYGHQRKTCYCYMGNALYKQARLHIPLQPELLLTGSDDKIDSLSDSHP